jgi:hypothetical protein
MNRWRVGEDIGSKETDGCPLTLTSKEEFCEPCVKVKATTIPKKVFHQSNMFW